jgi:uncharacterized protein with LGFP repeats
MSNLKVQIAGTIYQINEKAFRTTGWNKEPITPYFYASYVAAGQLVKQWVKNNYPNVVCRVKGSSFANGNSMNVNVCNADGSPIADADYRAINSFANLFEYGRYNGMEDMYESYENSGLVTDNGTKIDAGVKYVSVENRPSFGTVEWVRYELSVGRPFSDVSRYCDPKIVQKAMGL